MRKIKITDNYKNDLKRIRKSGWNERSLTKIIKLLQRGGKIPAKLNDHPLRAKYRGYRDCHIDDDWVLIYKNEKNCLILERTGSHSDLFEQK